MDAIVALLFNEFLGKDVWLWLLFLGIVVALLVFDLTVLNKKDHEIGVAGKVYRLAQKMLLHGHLDCQAGPDRAVRAEP